MILHGVRVKVEVAIVPDADTEEFHASQTFPFIPYIINSVLKRGAFY